MKTEQKKTNHELHLQLSCLKPIWIPRGIGYGVQLHVHARRTEVGRDWWYILWNWTQHYTPIVLLYTSYGTEHSTTHP
jgi:hypothetical protein